MAQQGGTITEEFKALSTEEADELVLEHRGWAESIARSVARAWNMDWRLDGLDGAAMEALIFCARRFQPARGVPFKGYARRRIHEAATEAAKKSRGWRRAVPGKSTNTERSREISAELLNVFPELREGQLPFVDDDSDGDMRTAFRQLLIGASFVAVREGIDNASPEELLDYKRMIEVVASLEVVHQAILWRIYWEGISLRTLAEEWGTDGLNVIREHKTVLEYLHKNLSLGKQFLQKPRVRPGLRQVALDLKRDGNIGPFKKIMDRVAGAQ